MLLSLYQWSTFIYSIFLHLNVTCIKNNFQEFNYLGYPIAFILNEEFIYFIFFNKRISNTFLFFVCSVLRILMNDAHWVHFSKHDQIRKSLCDSLDFFQQL